MTRFVALILMLASFALLPWYVTIVIIAIFTLTFPQAIESGFLALLIDIIYHGGRPFAVVIFFALALAAPYIRSRIMIRDPFSSMSLS